MCLGIRAGLMASALVMATAGAAGAGPQATPQPQPTPGPEPTPEPSPSPPAVAEPTRDIFDVLRQLRHKPPKIETADAQKKLMVAAAPVISYNPASGFGIGAAGNLAFFAGFPETTGISSVVASLIVTSKKQLLFNGKFDVSAANNEWVLHGDNRLYWTSQDAYGLGTSTTPDQAVNTKYTYIRVYESAYRRVRRNLYLGAGFLYNLHADVRPGEGAESAWPHSPYVTYSQRLGFDLSSQTSAGASVGVLLDSRDSAINPRRGWYANLDYQMFFAGFLGGTSTWQQLNGDLRTYVQLSRDARHRLAFWLYGNLVTGGDAPYFHLPATAMDTYGRSGRGYVQGRFRGQQMAYGEVEYRWTFTRSGLLGMVAFLDTETFSDEQEGERLFDSFATGAGLGLRVMLNKRSKTNLAFDVGRGNEGSTRVYFAVQEAF
jgi:outer membrane protein assembly factor BamA